MFWDGTGVKDFKRLWCSLNLWATALFQEGRSRGDSWRDGHDLPGCLGKPSGIVYSPSLAVCVTGPAQAVMQNTDVRAWLVLVALKILTNHVMCFELRDDLRWVTTCLSPGREVTGRVQPTWISLGSLGNPSMGCTKGAFLPHLSHEMSELWLWNYVWWLIHVAPVLEGQDRTVATTSRLP